MSDICPVCGEPARGFAAINDQRYCHGDNDVEPTCYTRAVMSLEMRRNPEFLRAREQADAFEWGDDSQAMTVEELRQRLGRP